jgi:hypothetical protein
VTATLRVSHRRKDGSKGARMVARAKTKVAVSDLATLNLKPTKEAKPLLAGRDGELIAQLRVVVTNGSGKKTVFRRRVRLFRKKRARK